MIIGAVEHKQLMQRIFAEFAQGNPELFLAHMADDFRWTIIDTTKFSGTFQGKQAVMDKLLTPLIAQLNGPIRVTADRFIAEDDYVVMQGHGTATTKIGKPYNNTYLHLLFEEEAAHILGVSYTEVNQAGLIPVAYTQGARFRPARRAPLDTMVHWETW